MSKTPAQLGYLLAGNALNKLGNSQSDPQVMLVSDSFEKFCEGRGFDKVDRRECEDAYKRRHGELV